MPFPLSIESPTSPFLSLQDPSMQKIWQRALALSHQSPRHRIMWPLQRRPTDTVQRLLNFIQPSAYFRPHRHPQPAATELIYLIQGSLSVFIFNDDGTILHHVVLSPHSPLHALADIDAGLWHTILAHEKDTVILEIKRGPYDPALDKIFAPWAPEETLNPHHYADYQAMLRKTPVTSS
ncbi:MAG: WbuC family cupin fold metalloprotein [Methylacidiphilales bacterium]|nr:WbuC family cupin fold metalloprotein [Candidatus Methylacidiphilales bacterium]MDW8349447.1 WbuC family cupin fold metalloprotein [Verrucomicrobiae bacterium]